MGVDEDVPILNVWAPRSVASFSSKTHSKSRRDVSRGWRRVREELGLQLLKGVVGDVH